jgi:hypothetical protein
MNERINELAEQAHEYANIEYSKWVPTNGYEGIPNVREIYTKKFAELMVLECANELIKWKAFIKWCFMKMFGGCFNLAETFRYELKKGAPDSIFAIAGFIILSMITILVTLLLSALLIESKETFGIIAVSCFWLAVFTFFYNIVKAAFECFVEEREEVFEKLKR